MQFALNYSLPARDLVARGEIEVDIYKCPDWPDLIADARQQRPAYVHFPLMAGLHNLDAVGLDTIERFLKQTGTLYVNTHLAPRATDFENMPPNTRDPIHTEQLVEAMLADINRMTSHFGQDNVIIENAPWSTNPKYTIPRPAIEPSIIRRVVHESGCGFLLDIAHASIAAKYLGMDVHEYIDQLPVDRLRELHVAGTRYDDEKGFWVDHYPMTSEDWPLMEWAMQHIHTGDWPAPWAVALEYGGVGPKFEARSDPEVIRTEAHRIYPLTHPVGETP